MTAARRILEVQMHRNDMRPLSESRRKTLLAKSEPMGVGNGQSLGEGKFTAVVSTFNVVDSQGDHDAAARLR